VLVAEAASFTLTGATVALQAARKLVAAAGSYTWSGTSATLSTSQPFVPSIIVELRTTFDQTLAMDSELSQTADGRSTFTRSIDLRGDID
jgi:hypothetical protein